MNGTTLITGADGYIGRKLAEHLLAESDDRLVLTVHAHPGEARFDDKRARIEQALGPAAAPRVTVLPADVGEDGGLKELEPDSITRIVHAAAVTKYNAERDLAQRVNIDGTARLAAFAARCGNLQRFALLSTLHAAGKRVGTVPEQRLSDAGFANNYEWSKWNAEEVLWSQHPDLPFSILRLPTVVCETEHGPIAQINSFHRTLKLYYYGFLSLVPGDRACLQYVVPATFAIPAIARLLDPEAPSGVYHVSPSGDGVAPLETLVDLVLGIYETDRSYQRRGLLRPLYCDEDSFNDLIAAAQSLRAGPVYEAIDSITPFAAQMYLPKVFENDALRAAWPGYFAPDPVELVRTVATELIATRFGRATREESTP